MIRDSFLLLLAFIVLSNASECVGEQCRFISPIIDPSLWDSSSDIASSLNDQLLRSHWYYLRNSRVLYTAQVQTMIRKIFFFYHQSVIGTFLSIVSFNRQSGISQLNTLVKVGSGLSQEPLAPGTLPNGQKIKVDIDKKVKQLADDENNKDINGTQEIIEVPPKQEQADYYLKKTYWYYLRGANIIDDRAVPTQGQIQYHVLTYINIVGTFLVVASCQGDQVKAQTFVRLGRGGFPQQVPEFN